VSPTSRMGAQKMNTTVRWNYFADFRREFRRQCEADQIRKAYARGLAEGRAEVQADVARRMLRMKMALADIAEMTGLTKAKIKQLAARAKT